MINSLNNIMPSVRLKRIAASLLCVAFLSFFIAPDAEAACPNPAFAALGNPVELISCTEGKAQSTTSVTVSVPANVAVGDLLVFVVGKDDDDLPSVPAGWTAAAIQLVDDNDGYLRVYTRVADGTELASYSVTWTTNEDAYAYMMRFTGASGLTLFTSNSGNTGTAVAPSLDTLIEDTLILRLAAWDRRPVSVDPATIMTGHTNITQDYSRNSNFASMGSAAYTNQAAIGSTLTGNFENGNEQWGTITFGIEPIQFRFSMPDATASVCGVQQVTVSVTDRLGNPMTWFQGTVTLSTSAGSTGDWFDAGALNGVLNNGTANDGVATYQFSSADNGVATFNFHRADTGSFSFDLDWGVFEEHSSFDPTLTIDNNCRFRIAHDGEAGTCAVESITISVVDSDGNAATRYSGTILIEADSNEGTYTLNTGTGTFDDATADDGDATYQFVQGESQVVLDFLHTTANPSVDFNISDSGNPTFSVDGGFDPSLNVASCSIRFSHDGTSDVCSPHQITMSVVDGSGTTIPGYTGTVSLSVDSNDGTWANGDGAGTFTPGASGTATYTFVAGDSGDVVLNYSRASSGTVNFNATASGGVASPSAPYDDDLVISNCTAEISVNATANVCSPSETISITIRNSGGGIATDFAGAVVITTDTSHGDYANGAGVQGSLDNGAAGDGVAVYTFHADDDGTVDLEFSTSTVESLVFNVSSTFISFNSGASSENLQVLSCEFRISHSGSMDNCSPETVTISVFNSAGSAVTDYVGTVNLSTSTSNGTWSDGGGNGTTTDPVAEDGSATYNFVSADNGSVTLSFSNLTVETTNINVSDGVSTDSNASFDPNMEVSACEFRITLVDGTMSGCSFELVTIAVYDSGGSIATGFTGTVTLETSTIQGTWAYAGALNGTLTETTPGDGIATYVFVPADNGSAIFQFTSETAETLNFNVSSGDISEDSSFDPDLEVTGCVVATGNHACFPGTGSGMGNLSINGEDPGRMVVMIIWHIDPTPKEVATATFDGANMTLIYEQDGGNTAIEMWGILDDDLPDNSGSYAGAYTWNSAPANGPSMCMIELQNVDQDFPVVNVGIPTLGEVNGNSFTPDGAPLDMTTTITTSANNAMILTAGLSDFTQSPSSWFNSVSPNPPMSQLFFNNNDQNPELGTGGGSSGIKAVKGIISVTDTDSQDALTNASHIVASFNPRVSGAADVEGYVPVELFETLSGNIGYKAIGTSLRTLSNTASADACDFVNFATGTTAVLSMPPSSTVRKAYLYWGGSGEEGDLDDTVTFGLSGAEISVTADETFMIENVGASLDYFAGYKDVTSQVTGNGTYVLQDLVVQEDAPWSNTEGCGGGWALVVVYDNAKERFRVANIFHGFQPFQNSSFALVPRNFRFATTDDDPNGYLPSGEITHITLEGDETLATGAEALGIQQSPGSELFTTLSNSFNPVTSDFNSTVTRPIFYEPGDSAFYEWDETAGINSDGYEIDQAGDEALVSARTGSDPTVWEIGSSWGFDIDTHFLKGNESGTPLYAFSQPGNEAEQITTQYSSGQDLVLLIAEIITVTNFDLADLEIFKTQSGDFKVSGTGQYHFQVTNNGNGGVSGGFANGRVLVADVLPAGLTLASVTGTDWSCTTSSNAFICEFDIATDCNIADGCAADEFNLSNGESLPTLKIGRAHV